VTLWVQPDARVSHVVGHSSRGLGDLSAIQAESNMWLVRKHYGRLAALLCALDLGITTLAFGAIEAFRGDDQALRRRMRRIRALRHPFTPPRRRVMQPQSFLSATSAGGRVQLQPDGVTPLGEGRR
jgi:hypothetical protein